MKFEIEVPEELGQFILQEMKETQNTATQYFCGAVGFFSGIRILIETVNKKHRTKRVKFLEKVMKQLMEVSGMEADA